MVFNQSDSIEVTEMPDIVTEHKIRWLPDYMVGVQEIDHEHQGLFALAESYRLAMRAGKDRETLQQILNELFDYTHYHFAHEEELMERISYPYYPDHCRQHEGLRIKLRAIRERWAEEDIGMTNEVMKFLVDWLKCHTTTSDRRIGSYMRKRGLVA
jgi:hemerythrin-like metal-binding protein